MLLDPVEQGSFGVNGTAQVGPVGPSPPSDHVVDGRQRIALMVEMPVPHRLPPLQAGTTEDKRHSLGAQN